MTIKEQIKHEIEKLTGLSDFVVEFPADEKRGDLAINAAMVGWKKSGFANPRAMAEDLKTKIENDERLKDLVKSVEIAGPGFVNLFVRESVLESDLVKMTDVNSDSAKNDFFEDIKVLVEYSSPNIAKRFSVGHFRSTIVGQAIYNFYKNCGALVSGDNHLGDWGTQFGMIIAAVWEKKLDVTSMSLEEIEKEYVEFNQRITEDKDLKEKAREAFAKLEAGDASARKIWEQVREVSLVEFDKIYERLSVKIDAAYGESFFEDKMQTVIEEFKNKGVARISEGALIVEFLDESDKEILPPAMLLKSNGTTTYFTRDMATLKYRLHEMNEGKGFDKVIYEVGGEQKLHLKQVFEAAKLAGWVTGQELVHIAHGLLTLPEGKMSTRKGNTVKLEELMDRAVEEVKTISRGEMSSVDIEKMAIGALKFNELKRSPGSDYVFRWEEALSLEGNSAPYLNYVFVRTRGILAKVQERSAGEIINDLNEDERSLAAWLTLRWNGGGVIKMAAENYAPQLVCAYLFELAKRFNGFYDRNKVLGGENEALRISLVKTTGKVIKEGLEILGIQVVERM